MCNNNVDSHNAVKQFKKSESIPMSHCTPEQRSNHLQVTLHWLRNMGKVDNSNDPTENLSKTDFMLPTKCGQPAEQGAYLMRNNDVDGESPNDVEQYKKKESVRMYHCTPEQRSKDL